jgi:glycosidase
MIDFQKFVNTAKSKNQNIILELDPNHSSDQHPWFIKSINKEEPYTSFYVWANGKVNAGSRTLMPPNNWVNIFVHIAMTYIMNNFIVFCNAIFKFIL